jgi:hypothetical protein
VLVFLGLVAFGVVFATLMQRYRKARKREDTVDDATLAELQGSAWQMAVLRRDPRTGKVDL